MWLTSLSEQQLQVSQQFCSRAHGAERLREPCCLTHGDGGWNPFDTIYCRTFQLIEKLPGLWRKRFDVTALTFCEQCVERQTAFSGSADSTDHRYGIVMNLQRDSSQVVDSGSFQSDV